MSEDRPTTYQKRAQLLEDNRRLYEQLAANEEAIRVLFVEKNEIVAQEVAAWFARWVVVRRAQDKAIELPVMDSANNGAPDEKRIWWNQGLYSFSLSVTWAFEQSDEPHFTVELTSRVRWSPYSSFARAFGSNLEATIIMVVDAAVEKLCIDYNRAKQFCETVQILQSDMKRL